MSFSFYFHFSLLVTVKALLDALLLLINYLLNMSFFNNCLHNLNVMLVISSVTFKVSTKFSKGDKLFKVITSKYWNYNNLSFVMDNFINIMTSLFFEWQTSFPFSSSDFLLPFPMTNPNNPLHWNMVIIFCF